VGVKKLSFLQGATRPSKSARRYEKVIEIKAVLEAISLPNNEQWGGRTATIMRGNTK
jgi:hypothetical protein